MSNLDFYSMLVLGLFGTGHCMGMCGPLVLAFPAQTGRLSSHAFYHLGRITTYVTIGAAMGAMGAGLKNAVSGSEHLVWMARIQVGFSLVAASFLLLFGLSRLKIVAEPGWMSLTGPASIPGLAGMLRYALVKKSRFAMFLRGLMFGLLPCGLSFAAFARALPSGGSTEGGLLVLAFSVGTIPGLLLVGTGASRYARRFSAHSEILSGLLMIGMAVSLAADAIQAMAGTFP